MKPVGLIHFGQYMPIFSYRISFTKWVLEAYSLPIKFLVSTEKNLFHQPWWDEKIPSQVNRHSGWVLWK